MDKPRGTLLNVMWQAGWEGRLGDSRGMYVYGRVALLCARNYHNIVHQLYFNIKLKKKKEKSLAFIEYE